MPEDQWPLALLVLIAQGPKTLRELCTSIVGRDPGDGDTLPNDPQFIALNRMRQSMESWGLWEYGEGRTYNIRPCGSRAFAALHVDARTPDALRWMATTPYERDALKEISG